MRLNKLRRACWLLLVCWMAMSLETSSVRAEDSATPGNAAPPPAAAAPQPRRSYSNALYSKEWYQEIMKEPVMDPNAAVEVLYDGCQYGLASMSGGQLMSEVRCVRVARIQHSQGLSEALVVFDLPSDARLYRLNAVTYHPDGTRRTQSRHRRVKNVVRPTEHGPRSSITLRFAHPEARVGDVVSYEIAYAERSGMPFGQHFMESNTPVHRMEVRLDGDGIEYEYVTHGLVYEGMDCSGVDAKGNTNCEQVFGRSLHTPVEAEALTLSTIVMPIGVIWMARKLDLEHFTMDLSFSWSKMPREWLSNLNTSILGQPPELKVSTQASLTETLMTAWHESQRALDLRNSSLARTPTAHDRQMMGYGGLNEQAYYLTSLLKSLNLKPALLLVLPEPWYFGEQTIPSLLGLASPVVRVGLDGQSIYLDVGCFGCAPGEVRPELLGRQGLEVGFGDGPELAVYGMTTLPTVTHRLMPVMPEDGSKPTKLTYASQPWEWSRFFNLSEEVELTERGLMMRGGYIRMGGPDAARLRYSFLLRRSERDVDAAAVSKAFKDGLEESRMRVLNVDEVGEPLELELSDSLVDRSAYSLSDAGILLDLKTLLPEYFTDNLTDVRTQPIDLRSMADQLVTVRFKIPEGYTLQRTPSSDAIHHALCQYDRNVKLTEGVLELSEHLTVASKLLKVDEYPEFYDVCLKPIRTSRQQHLFLAKQTPANSAKAEPAGGAAR